MFKALDWNIPLRVKFTPLSYATCASITLEFNHLKYIVIEIECVCQISALRLVWMLILMENKET